MDFVKCNMGAQLGKSGGKEGFTLLCVQGAFDQVAGMSTGKAGGIDGDVDSVMKRGSKKGKSLNVIPVGVGKKKGEGAATLGGPVDSRLAET